MRRAGILLHPTSLPGPYGIGDIGPAARDFLVWLEAANQRVWQMLPLHPVDGYGSPYASPSAFAASPLLLSPDDLVEDGWLLHSERPWQGGDPHRVEWERVFKTRRLMLENAADRVRAAVDLSSFATANPWARDWSLFRALVGEHGWRWPEWPEPLRDRDPDALSTARDRLQVQVGRHLALQWLFREQWGRLRAQAKRRGVALWGDMPFFVGAESCDTWANRHLFRLDEGGRPTVVTGVPPDAFSPQGQKWGHAHYDEDAQAAESWSWWGDRLQALLELVDAVRIDHFRGVEAVWEVPAAAPDATSGRWIPGPGAPLLESLRRRLGGLPLVAEDLGIITPAVEALRDEFELPGMAILHFAWGQDPLDPLQPYQPHNHRPNLVVFPGTHDNDTTVGWYRGTDELTRDQVRRYFSIDGGDIAWDLIRAAYRSVACTAIVTMQDVLGLGSDARMNTPGTSHGNWSWRMAAEAMNLVLAGKLADQAYRFGRAPLRS